MSECLICIYFDLCRGHRDAVTCVAVTLDGKLMCSGSKDKTVRIYNTGNKQLISSTAVHDGPVRCVLFSKSAQLTITGGADFKVKVWFIEDMSLMHVFEEYVTPITAIVLTPDTSFLLIGTSCHTSVAYCLLSALRRAINSTDLQMCALDR